MNEETIFHLALQKATAEQRAAFLDGACANQPELRARLDKLLRANVAPGDFLDRPPVDPYLTRASQPDADEPVAVIPGPVPGETIGSRIGPYKLLQKLGEGGMGTVWVAEQTEPVKRRVALKLIRAGMDYRQVILRFEAERQALALMDHTNIARVLDAGTTEAGLPYFVMELVKGVPITRYCDELHLSIRERLELFVPVCQAIQHAHQKGIIHRDIKPSNVLVAMQDGRPVPKVIDFGVAKAIGPKLTERTMCTEFGAVIGTLEYMSPEQAELSALDIDTRTDVYALGVLLYELLAGSTPLDHARLRKAAFAEVLRRIREEEPPRPSTRITESKESLPALAAQRRTEPRRLGAQVRGELDWIVMRCLEKDRTRRYETANGLGRDVERFLHDEPVEAGPPSAGYRLRKFVRRNKGPVLAVAIVLVALVVGVVGTTIGLVQAEAARRAEAEQRGIAEAKEQDARQAAVAERKAKNAVSNANNLLASIFNDLNPQIEEKGGPALRVQLGERLMQAAQALEGEAMGDPLAVADLQHRLGVTLLSLGHAEQAIAVLTRSRTAVEKQLSSQDPVVLTIMSTLATAYLHVGRLREAIALDQEVVSGRKTRLGADHIDTLNSMNNLALAYQNADRLPEAIELHEAVVRAWRFKLGPDNPSTLTGMNNQAMAYQRAGRHSEALKLLEEVLSIRREKFGPDHPYILDSLTNLAEAKREAGQSAEAIRLLEPVLLVRKNNLGADHPDTFTTANNLAMAYQSAGLMERAIQLNEDVVRTCKGKLGPNHPLTLTCINNLASVYCAADRRGEAIPLFEQVLAAQKATLGPDHSSTLTTTNNLALAYMDAGRVADSIKLLDEVITAWRAKPGPPTRILIIMNNLASAYARAGRRVEAIRLFEDVLLIQKDKLGPNHSVTLSTANNLALAYQKTGRLKESIKLFEEVLAAEKAKCGADHPSTLTSKYNLALAYGDAGRRLDSVKLLEEVVPARKAKLGLNHSDTLMSMHNLAAAYQTAGRLQEAIRLYEELVPARKAKLGPDHRHTLTSMANLALAYLAAEQPDKALPLLNDYLAGERKSFRREQPRLASILASVCLELLKHRQSAAAEPLLRECLEIQQKAEPDAWTTCDTQAMLGAALAGQQRYSEAEPLLLQGYQGMKQREIKIPAERKVRLTEALERLVRLYDDWGKKDEVAKWRQELEARKTAEAKARP